MVVDILLTPENAKEQGYQWVDDLLSAIMKGKIRGIEDLDGKQFWRLGKAKVANCVVGLYKPIEKKKKKSV